MGALHANALAFLPSLTEENTSSLQTALNSGIRAVLNLPRKSVAPMSHLREKFGFIAVTVVRDKCLMLAAQKNRDKYIRIADSSNGPITRAKAKGDIRHPISKGHLGKMTSTAVDLMWNRIPKEIRDEPNFGKASRRIKLLFKKKN